MGATALSGKILLRIVVGVVFVSGLVSILVGLGHAIGRGAFSSQLLAGPLYIALAVWLFRGSDVARMVLAGLFALGLVLIIGLVWLIHDDVMTTTFMLTIAAISAAVLWVLVFSKRFRAELAANAGKYGKPEVNRS
jgi:peptidoglycan/LPS O-acetylase OafA/YrhL